MTRMQRSALIVALMAFFNLPAALAQEVPKAEAAAPVADTPAPDEMMPGMGMGTGGKCNKSGMGPGAGMGMGPMGAGKHCDRPGGMGRGMGPNCHRMGDGDCGCPQGRDLSRRVEELEKRLDMMQMMMRLMMK